jgi:predicted MPP superfamily phosphohydrolase
VIAASGGAVLVERRDTLSPALCEVVIPVAGLTRELSVVQATDLHAQSFGRAEGGIAALLGNRHVDAAVMTGDILDTWTQNKRPAYELADVLMKIAPRVYFLPGNHDPSDLGAALASRGVVPLQHATPVGIDASDPKGREVALVYGVDSASIAGAGGYGSKLLVIASHTPPNDSRLAAGAALGSGSRLFIAGHTHGGQIRIPGLGALLAPMSWEGEEGGRSGTNGITFLPDVRGEFVDGLYEQDGQRVFVCVGLGTTWFHARFYDRAELALLRFVPESG